MSLKDLRTELEELQDSLSLNSNPNNQKHFRRNNSKTPTQIDEINKVIFNDIDNLPDQLKTKSLENSMYSPMRENNPFTQIEQSNLVNLNLEKENKIESTNFEVELKTIMSNIRQYRENIKSKLMGQKELNETIIQTDFNDHSRILINKDEEVCDPNDVSVFLRPLSPFQDYQQQKKVNQNRSLMISPNNLIRDFSFQDDPSQNDISMIEPNFQQNNQNEANDEIFHIEKEKFEALLKEIQTKHQAEKDQLNCEILVYKKVILDLKSKVNYLHDLVCQRERELTEIDKLYVIKEKLKQENDQLKDENSVLRQRYAKMREVMLHFDVEQMEQDQEDIFLVEQLLSENQQLRNLLMIQESYDLEYLKQIQEQLIFSEELLQNQSLQNSTGKNMYNHDRNRRQSSSAKKDLENVEVIDKMPQQVQMILNERLAEKEEERRVKEEMRRLAEEEIRKELKLAEQFFRRSGGSYDFERTQKRAYQQILQEKDDEDDELDREDSPERQASPERNDGMTQTGISEEQKQSQIQSPNKYYEEQLKKQQDEKIKSVQEDQTTTQSKIGNEQS